MPRNSSGTYTLPAGNPVVPNTLIETTWANPTMSDIGSAITDSLDRQGRGSMLAPLKLTDGTAVAPSLSFSSESTTGMYRAAAGTLGLTIAGVLKLSLTATALTLAAGVAFAAPGGFTGQLAGPLGTAGAPTFTFTGDLNTGMFSPGADTVALSVAGTELARVNAVGLGVGVVAANAFRLEAAGASANSAIARFSGGTVQTRGLELSSFQVGGINGVGFLWNAPGSPASGTHAWAIAGTETMRLDANGMLAVTPTAGTALTINQISGQAAIRATDGTVITRLATSSGTTAFFGTESASTLSLIAGNATRMSVTSAGVWQVQAPSAGNSFNVAQIDGSHAVLTSQALSGGTVSWRIENSSNTAGSEARLQLVTGGATAADPFVTFTVSGATSYALGIDNSDIDAFVISRGSVIGTNNALRLSNAGNFSLEPPTSGTTLTVGQVSGGIALVTSEALSGAEAIWALENSSNTASSAARLSIITGGATAADPNIRFTITGVTNWSVGADNSDGDAFVIASSTALGTSNQLRITTAGNTSLTAPSSGDTLSVPQIAGANAVITSSSLSGGVAQWSLSNTSNTASSTATLQITTAGTSAGDPFVKLSVVGTTTWSAGIDNSDSDTFKIDSSAALTTATNRLNVTTDGRVYGNALHDNAGAVTGTTNQYIASGTWSPTISAGVNLGASTVNAGQWVRVGNVVTASFNLTQAMTANNTISGFEFSLPIASNFTGIGDCSGVVGRRDAAGSASGTIVGSIANDTGVASWFFTTLGSNITTLTFTYVIR